MKIYEIKATILRTNPQIIRQFLISEESTFQILQEILFVLIGWNSDSSCEFDLENVRISQNIPLIRRGRVSTYIRADQCCLKDYLHVNDNLIFRFSANDPLMGQMMKEMDCIEMRLEVMNYRESDRKKLPYVVRYRGTNFPQNCTSVNLYNQAYQYFYSNGYYVRGVEKLSFGNNLFQSTKVNLELQIKYGHSGEKGGFVPDFSSFIAAESHLEQYSVVELKELAQSWGIGSLNTVRKAGIIEKIAGELQKKETVRNILFQLSAKEYTAFCKLCREPVYVSGSGFGKFQSLAEMGLTSKGKNGRIFGCYEMLIGYMELLDSGFDEDFRKMLAVRACLFGACRLYGFAVKDLIIKLMESCYPETAKTMSPEEIWKSAVQIHAANIQFVSASFQAEAYFMDTRAFSQQDTQMMVNGYKNLVFTPYIPSVQELERIESEGLHFSETTVKKLKNSITSISWMRDESVNMIIDEMYRGLHIGGSEDSIADWIFDVLKKRKTAWQRDQLVRLLNESAWEVRMAGFMGHTPQEMAEIRRKIQQKNTIEAPKKIMPNDPCPCGSGRKYKHCHMKA